MTTHRGPNQPLRGGRWIAASRGAFGLSPRVFSSLQSRDRKGAFKGSNPFRHPPAALRKLILRCRVPLIKLS